MDPLGGCGVVCSTLGRGIFHGLAGVGSTDTGNCNAHRNVSGCEHASCRDRVSTCLSGRLAATCAQPRYPLCDLGQCNLLSHLANDRSRPGFARILHCRASLRALFVVGSGWSRARWSRPEGDRDCHGIWHIDDGRDCLGCAISQQCDVGWPVQRASSNYPQRNIFKQTVAFGPSPGERPGPGPVHLQ